MSTTLPIVDRTGTEPRTDDEHAGPHDAATGRRWQRRPRAILTVILAVALLAAVAGAVPALSAQRDRARDGAVLAAASSTVTDLVAVDSATVQAAYDRLRAGATGEWGEQLAGQTDSFSRAVREAEVTSRGEITAAAVEREDGDTATALVAATAMVRNRQAPDGETRTYRISMDLVRTDERWLVAKLDFVP